MKKNMCKLMVWEGLLFGSLFAVLAFQDWKTALGMSAPKEVTLGELSAGLERHPHLRVSGYHFYRGGVCEMKNRADERDTWGLGSKTTSTTTTTDSWDRVWIPLSNGYQFFLLLKSDRIKNPD